MLQPLELSSTLVILALAEATDATVGSAAQPGGNDRGRPPSDDGDLGGRLQFQAVRWHSECICIVSVRIPMTKGIVLALQPQAACHMRCNSEFDPHQTMKSH